MLRALEGPSPAISSSAAEEDALGYALYVLRRPCLLFKRVIESFVV
jgi:hypothetical protein